MTLETSAWLARRGARVVAIDNSQAQLATARRLQHQHGLDFPLVHGNAESIEYPNASFDFVIRKAGFARGQSVTVAMLAIESATINTVTIVSNDRASGSSRSKCKRLDRLISAG